jgi:hypothetical protein
MSSTTQAPAAAAEGSSSVYEEVMALTEQLGPLVERWLREEFEQLFDHVVSVVMVEGGI